MGCDIHSTLEVRENGIWKFVRGSGSVDAPYGDEPIKDRSYRTFAILAGVRKGYGFAGVDTGDEFRPISEPKGVPDDASKEYLAHVELWNGDGHSHSFLTLAEILAFDFTRTVEQRGTLTFEEYEKWSRYGRQYGEQPDSWSGSVSGASVQHLPESEMDAEVEAFRNELRDVKWADQADARKAALARRDNLYVRCSWIQPYHNLCRELLTRTVPIMHAECIKRGIGYGDVRIVFFFDN